MSSRTTALPRSKLFCQDKDQDLLSSPRGASRSRSTMFSRTTALPVPELNFCSCHVQPQTSDNFPADYYCCSNHMTLRRKKLCLRFPSVPRKICMPKISIDIKAINFSRRFRFHKQFIFEEFFKDRNFSKNHFVPLPFCQRTQKTRIPGSQICREHTDMPSFSH
jgi:hypothetical protein